MPSTSDILCRAVLRTQFRYLDYEWEDSALQAYMKAIRWLLDGKHDHEIVPPVLHRLQRIDDSVWNGFDLSFLVDTGEVMGRTGKQTVERIEKGAQKHALLSPHSEDTAPFVQRYENKEAQAIREQVALFREMIRNALGSSLSDDDLDKKVLADRLFFEAAYKVVTSFVCEQKGSPLLHKIPIGMFEMRNKPLHSAWTKSRLNKSPFYALGDLLSVTLTARSISEMAHACQDIQAKTKVVSKSNAYLYTIGDINTVQYALDINKLVVEVLVKVAIHPIENQSLDNRWYEDAFRELRRPMEEQPAAKALALRLLDRISLLSDSDLDQVLDRGRDLFEDEQSSEADLRKGIQMSTRRMANYYRIWAR